MNIPIQDLLDNFDKLRHEIVQRLSTQKDTPEPEPDSPFTGSPLPSEAPLRRPALRPAPRSSGAPRADDPGSPDA